MTDLRDTVFGQTVVKDAASRDHAGKIEKNLCVSLAHAISSFAFDMQQRKKPRVKRPVDNSVKNSNSPLFTSLLRIFPHIGILCKPKSVYPLISMH